MSKDKNFSVTITDEMFFEDLLWMSYRYCIGRKTISASHHAGDIAKYTYDALSSERKKYMAHDIRREINSVVHRLDNVTVYDYRHHIPQDALSTIFYRLLEKYGDVPPEWIYTHVKFDIEDENIKLDGFEPDKEKYYMDTLLGIYVDLIPWIKLANCFDEGCHKTIVTECDGVVAEHVCFPYPYLSVTLEGEHHLDKKWCPVKRYLLNPVVDFFIDMEYVKEIR